MDQAPQIAGPETAEIYLDHNATTPLAPEVAEAMDGAMREGYANPASQHAPGGRARRVVEEARERIVELLGGVTSGMRPDRLVFTSGGTEANNLALIGLASEAADDTRQVIISPIEHPSVAAAAEELARRGVPVARLAVNSDGVVDASSLEPLLTTPTRLVSVMLGNNETGAIQPVAELAEIAARHGAALHTDAVQAVGKIDVRVRELGAAAMTCTAHKLHGPLGIGGLLLREGADLRPQQFGGFQQAGLRPGTESVVLVVGMRVALERWHAERAERRAHMENLRQRFERQILSNLPTAVVVAADAGRLPHTSNISLVGLDRQALFVALDQAGVACSTGSACASGSSEASPVLIAMGLSEDVIRGSLRFSFAATTTIAEVDEAARRMLLVCKRLEQRPRG